MDELRRSTEFWSNGGTEKLLCSVPGCGHVGDGITKAHCRESHNTTRDEVVDKYGMPYRVTQINNTRLKDYQFKRREKKEKEYGGK